MNITLMSSAKIKKNQIKERRGVQEGIPEFLGFREDLEGAEIFTDILMFSKYLDVLLQFPFRSTPLSCVNLILCRE